MEVGYQIGCGIIEDDIESITAAGITPGVGIPFVNGSLLPITLGLSASEQIKIDLKPGTVNIVPVDKKSFKGTKSRVAVHGFRIKVDGCAGQSFFQSGPTRHSRPAQQTTPTTS